MNKYIKRLFPIVLSAAIITSSCTESKTDITEEKEITSMDSTSKAVKKSTDELEEQTKKVEASLEKLDKEFETAK